MNHNNIVSRETCETHHTASSKLKEMVHDELSIMVVHHITYLIFGIRICHRN